MQIVKRPWQQGESILVLSFVILLTLVNPIYPQNQPIAAVPGIRGTNTAEAVISACRNLVETALIKTGQFSVLSYTDIEEILAAQEYSLSDCSDEACAVEIGKLLAAEQIVIGEISGIEDKFILNLRLVDIATGRSLNAEAIRIETIDDLHDQAFIATYALVGMKYIPEAEMAVRETGEIYITAPEHLTFDVYLDGELRGETPILLEDIPFGLHIVETRRENYYFKQEVSVQSKKVEEIFADVRSLKGSLLVQVSPSDAEGFSLFVNNKKQLPGLIQNLPVGTHPVRVEGNGWFYQGTVSVEHDKTGREVLSLLKVGSIQIDVPIGCKIELFGMGETIPITSHEVYNLRVGEYIISVNHPDYEEYQADIDILQNETTEISPVLVHTASFQISQLEIQRQTILIKRKKLNIGGWSTAGLGLLGAVSVTGFEAIIWKKTQQLNDTYAQYEATTISSELNALGAEIDQYKRDIQEMRTFRNISLIGTAIPAIVSTVLFLVRPSTREIDERIDLLKDQQNENDQ